MKTAKEIEAEYELAMQKMVRIAKKGNFSYTEVMLSVECCLKENAIKPIKEPASQGPIS